MDYLSGGWMPVPFVHGATSLGGIDVAVFLIDNVEDAACVGTLTSVPLSDIKGLLTDKAAGYYRSLGL